MPEKPADAPRFTKKANTAARKRQHFRVYQSMRKRGYSEGRAIRAANDVLADPKRRARRRGRRRGRYRRRTLTRRR
jgi:hypothetical protein